MSMNFLERLFKKKRKTTRRRKKRKKKKITKKKKVKKKPVKKKIVKKKKIKKKPVNKKSKKHKPKQLKKHISLKLKDITLTKKPLYSNDTLIYAIDFFSKNKLNVAPVLRDEKVIGIVTAKNLVNAADRIGMDKLKKGNIIQNFSIIIDWEKIGYRSYIVEINLKNYNKKYVIIDYVRKNPNLWFIIGSIGHNIDLEFEFVLDSITRLHEIIKDISTKFPESIKNFQYFTLKKIHKFGAIPEI